MPGFTVHDGGAYRNTHTPDSQCCSDPSLLCRRCARKALAMPPGALYDADAVQNADPDELAAMAEWLANNAHRPDLGVIDEHLPDPVINWSEPAGNAFASPGGWPPPDGADDPDGVSRIAHQEEAHRRYHAEKHARARDEREAAERDAENRRRLGLDTNPDGRLVIPGQDAPWWMAPIGNAGEHLPDPVIDWAEWARSSR